MKKSVAEFYLSYPSPETQQWKIGPLGLGSLGLGSLGLGSMGLGSLGLGSMGLEYFRELM